MSKTISVYWVSKRDRNDKKYRNYSIENPPQILGGRDPELTHIKCYRGWEVDEGSADTLTPIRGYPNSEPESVRQTRGPGPHSRPLPARRSAAQAAHPRRVLRPVRGSSQSRAAALEPAAAHDSAQTQRAQNPLRSGRGAAGAQARLAGQRPVVRQTPQGGAARVAGTSRAARRCPKLSRKNFWRSVPRRSTASCVRRACSIPKRDSRPTRAR